jgi:hypothetical protein
VRAGSVERPELVLSGTPEIIGRVIAGTVSLADAQADGLDYDGDPDILGRLQREEPATASRARKTIAKLGECAGSRRAGPRSRSHDQFMT